jgi:uncharacterized protein
MDRSTLVITHLIVLMIGFILAGPSLPQPATTIDGTHEATANIVAVAQDGSGAIGQVTARIEPGSGRVLLDTNPFVETDTQFSATTARDVAEDVTGVELADKNVIYTFTIEGDYIGGPSAGAAMTLATIAAVRNQTVPDDIVATGTIRPDGRIGQVGGVIEKAVTAGERDMETFYVPWGQANVTTYQEVIEQREYRGFMFRDIAYVPRTIHLDNITRQRYDMGVRGVRAIGTIVEEVLTEGREGY